MQKIVSAILLAIISVSALAGDETLSACSEGNNPATKLPWLPGGAKMNSCHQFVVGAGLGTFNFIGGQVAAFGDGLLLGLRAARPQEGDHAPIGYQPADWVEHGSFGPPGQLWWGSTPRGWHIFSGQESSTRLQKEVKLLPYKEQMAISAWTMQRMMAMMSKQPFARQAGDEKWMVFRTKEMNYRQIGSTTATFAGGLGGINGFTTPAPGRLENARLRLDTSTPTITGELTFTMTVDQRQRSFKMPIMVDPEPDFRMHAAAAGSTSVECRKRPNRSKGASDACDYDARLGTERYDATGAFFGDHASLAALQVRMTVNIPDKNHTQSIGTGVIVFKAE